MIIWFQCGLSGSVSNLRSEQVAQQIEDHLEPSQSSIGPGLQASFASFAVNGSGSSLSFVSEIILSLGSSQHGAGNGCARNLISASPPRTCAHISHALTYHITHTFTQLSKVSASNFLRRATGTLSKACRSSPAPWHTPYPTQRRVKAHHHEIG